MADQSEMNRTRGASSPSDEPRGVKAWLGKLLIGLICAVFGGAITIVWAKYDNRLRTVEYLINSSSSIIAKPDLAGKKLSILVDDRAVTNISTVSIEVFNRTDRDYNDMPIIIEFRSANGGFVPILSQSIQDQFGASVAGVLDSDGRLSYRLAVANRSDTPIFRAQFTFEREQAPSVEVIVPMRGVDTTLLTLDEAVSGQRKELSITSVAMLLAGYTLLMCIPPLMTYLRERRRRSEEMWAYEAERREMRDQRIEVAQLRAHLNALEMIRKQSEHDSRGRSSTS